MVLVAVHFEMMVQNVNDLSITFIDFTAVNQFWMQGF